MNLSIPVFEKSVTVVGAGQKFRLSPSYCFQGRSVVELRQRLWKAMFFG